MNSFVTTRYTSCSKINGVLNECCDFVDDLKEISNLMNTTFVPIADKLIKERLNCVSESNDTGCFD